jgi:sRNA-binding protein
MENIISGISEGSQEKSDLQPRSRLDATIDALRARFPSVFPWPPLPLAIGIREEVIAACPDLEPPLIRRALAVWVHQPRYQSAISCLIGVARIRLDGSLATPVTYDEAEFALGVVRDQRKRYWAKQKRLRAQLREEGAKRLKKSELARKAAEKEAAAALRGRPILTLRRAS